MKPSVLLAVVLIAMVVAVTFGESDLRSHDADEMFPSLRDGDDFNCPMKCYGSCWPCGHVTFLGTSSCDSAQCQGCDVCGCPNCAQ